MIIKSEGFSKPDISPFSLIGDDENALSHAFAYFISKDRNAFFSFIQYLGLKFRKSVGHYKNVRIEVQKKSKQGITDIEISHKNDYHIIIECKIKKGKATRQRSQYNKSFNKDVKNKILIFLTQEKQSFQSENESIAIKHLSWLEIINIFDKKIYLKNEIYKDFNKFIERGYKMTKLIKEILVQDLGDKKQIKNFKENYIYRRPEVTGRPIYFAPYFTSKSREKKGKGIHYIAKILGIMTIKPKDRKRIKDDLKNFAEKDKDLSKKWENGLKNERGNKVFTFYFLGKPLEFNKPLLKSKNKDSKGWIGSHIPPNRTVSFDELLKRINENDTKIK